jgi:hypothetical protein
MAVIVEDGNGLSNSNSYVSDAELVSYATSRGITLIASTTVLLIKSTDWLETKIFIGNKGSQNQALQWPRIPYSPVPLGTLSYAPLYMFPIYLSVDGYIITATMIPGRLKKAQLEAAIQMDAGYDVNAVMEQDVLSEQVGPIKVEYQQGSSSQVYLPVAEKILAPLLSKGTGNIAVGRS